MRESQYSKKEYGRILPTLESVEETICQLIDWNQSVACADDYYTSANGLQLLAANCTLITAIGEGINRVNRIAPGFLASNYPDIPWHAIVGMRNHIAHGYFELDADLIFEAVSVDIPPLLRAVRTVIKFCRETC